MKDVERQALNLLKTKYKSFSPTLAHEKLVEQLRLSEASVRQAMIEANL